MRPIEMLRVRPCMWQKFWDAIFVNLQTEQRSWKVDLSLSDSQLQTMLEMPYRELFLRGQ